MGIGIVFNREVPPTPTGWSQFDNHNPFLMDMDPTSLDGVFYGFVAGPDWQRTFAPADEIKLVPYEGLGPKGDKTWFLVEDNEDDTSTAQVMFGSTLELTGTPAVYTTFGVSSAGYSLYVMVIYGTNPYYSWTWTVTADLPSPTWYEEGIDIDFLLIAALTSSLVAPGIGNPQPIDGVPTSIGGLFVSRLEVGSGTSRTDDTFWSSYGSGWTWSGAQWDSDGVGGAAQLFPINGWNTGYRPNYIKIAGEFQLPITLIDGNVNTLASINTYNDWYPITWPTPGGDWRDDIYAIETSSMSPDYYITEIAFV